jgi:broad specificity phosphatase PhoE
VNFFPRPDTLVKPLLTLLLMFGMSGIALPSSAEAPAAVAPTAAVEIKGAALLQALRRGGYIIYFRHASTDFSANDEHMTDYADCSPQRNLTDQGRADARAIGAAIRSLGIPIGAVLASPFCRTLETARLMFDRATAEMAVRGGPPQAESARYADLRALLAKPVEPGANTVIASHGNPFRAVAGGSYLAEGEAAIIEPRGTQGFRVVARIRRDEWKALASP